MLKTEFHLALENGTPTDDTFQRIFAIIKPKEFEKCFVNWVKSVIKVPDKEIVSLDGKTLRGSQDKEDNLDVIHMVSAWANQARAVFGQIAVDGKTNEITAVPELLELLDIENTIITADAMSCQKEIVKKDQQKRGGLCDWIKG